MAQGPDWGPWLQGMSMVGEARERKRERERQAKLDEANLEESALRRKVSQSLLDQRTQETGEKESARRLGGFEPSSVPDFDIHKPFHLQPPAIQQAAIASARAMAPGATVPQIVGQINLAQSLIGGGRVTPPEAPPGMIAESFEGATPTGEKYKFKPAPRPLIEEPIPLPSGEPGNFVRLGDDIRAKHVVETPASKMTEGEKAFAMNASEIVENLNTLRSTIDKFGTFEMALPFGASGPQTTQASANLKALPYKIAIQYAKLVDPSSVAREGEVAAAQKYLIPTGLFANNAVAKAVIDGMLAEVERRKGVYNQLQATQGKPALPTAAPQAPAPARKFDSVQEAEAADLPPGTEILVFDPPSKTYRRARVK